MRTDGTNIGETIKALRKARNISKMDLSEMVGISVSHLEKIESGARRPGMDTYQKIFAVLKLDVVVRNEMETVQEKCVAKAQEILMGSTEKQALFMLKILECMSENIDIAL
ncbi:helix-turn-helix transcriptional regulator [Lachnospiraceae bacterium 54-11]